MKGARWYIGNKKRREVDIREVNGAQGKRGEKDR